MTKMLQDFAAEKTAYQAYKIEHGIERISIQIPLRNARDFETKFNVAISEGITSKAELLQIVADHDGTIRVKAPK